MTTTKDTRPARGALGRLWHRRLEGKAGEQEVQGPRQVGAAPIVRAAEEPEATAQGVIWSEVLLLTRYGTAYGLFDELTAGYDCTLKSDAYRLAEYVGDHVWVSGSLTCVGGVPVMEVTRLQLLEMKWMR